MPMFVIPALRRQREEDYKFMANMGQHIVRLFRNINWAGDIVWLVVGHLLITLEALDSVPSTTPTRNVAPVLAPKHLGRRGRRFRNLRSFLAIFKFRATLGYMRPCLKK